MKKASTTTSGDHTESPQAALTRKLYRYISEAAKRVDEGTSRSKTISDLFTPSLEVYRQKLRENCEKLIFADPLLYGKKAQELLWRKGYYEAVATSKRLRQASKDQEHLLILAHIDAGIGHYHNLIFKVQHEIDVHISLPVDYAHIDEAAFKETNSEDLKEFVKSFIQTCLIYLGDLCRYKSDYDEALAFTMSYRYYMQAASVDINIGMPYNQLGTLHTGRNHHLDSVTYYIVCLLCNVPFDGAEGNLTRIFDKNNKLLDTLGTNPDIIDQQETMKNMICKFLTLVEHWFFDKPISNFNETCTSVLFDMKDCLRFQPLMTPEEFKSSEEFVKYVQQNELSPDYMSSNLTAKMALTLLLLTNKLQKEKSNLIMPLKTFTLTILSQILHKLHSDLVAIGCDIDIVSKVIQEFKEKVKNQKNIKTSSGKLENGFHDPDNAKHVKGNVTCILSENNCEKQNIKSADEDKPVDIEEGMEDVQEESAKEDNNKIMNGDTNDKLTQQSRTKNKKSSVLQKLRRRKRYAGSEGSESSDDDDVDDASSHSDGMASDEEDQLSTDESDDDDEDLKDSYSTTSTSEDEHEMDTKNIGQSKHNVVSTPKENDSEGVDDCQTESNNKKSPVDDGNDPDKENTLDETTQEPIEFGEKMFEEFLEHNNVLVALHLLLNWLFGESALIVSLASSGRPMFQALVNVLNAIHGQLFPKLSWNNYSLSNQFHPSLKKFHELFFSLKYNSFRKMPVAEDYDVKDMEICTKGLKYIDWTNHKKTTLSIMEANTIRLMKIVDFGAFVVKLNVGIVFNKKLKLYLLKKVSNRKPNYKKYGRDVHAKSQRSYKQRNVDSEKTSTKQTGGSLMKNLGRLWLSEQVRALESEVGSKKQPNLPAYIILDADALCQQTHLVKQLVSSKKLIVLIPSIVLHTMDELKKESGAARSAIRWLENQLSNGSRFIRAQRPNENAPLPCVKYPKKMHRHVQNFIQIIEFCHFFLSNDANESSSAKANMNGSGDSKSNDKYQQPIHEHKVGRNSDNHMNSNLVVLLTGSSNLYTEQKDFSYKGVAHSAGVSMESIQDFYYKWKHCFGKGAKKR